MWLLNTKCQLQPQIIVITIKHHTFVKHSLRDSSVPSENIYLNPLGLPIQSVVSHCRGSVHLWGGDQQSLKGSGSYP